MATHTDFCKHDETICFIIDCALDSMDPIRKNIDQCAFGGAGGRGQRRLMDEPRMNAG